MTPDEAALTLSEHLRRHQWLVAVGIGELENGPALYVYTTKITLAVLSLPKEWEGYKVIRRISGRLHP